MIKVFFSQTGCTLHREEWNKLVSKINVVETKNVFEADYIIVWLCAMRTQLIDYSLMILEQFCTIRNCSPQKPKLFVGGCLQKMGGFDLEKVADETFVTLVELEQRFPARNKPIESKTLCLKGKFAAITIQSGCARRCKFCKTNYLDSHPQSKTIPDVIKEVDDAIKQGARYFVIAGTNNTEYGIDLYGKCMLKPLIEEILKREVEIVLLGGMTLDEFSVEQRKFIKNEVRINCIQLEIQSLIPTVRNLMGLTKTTEEVLQIINELRDFVLFRSSLMVGYPGETDEDFEQELDLIEKHNLWFITPNIFDNTIGTPAYDMPQVEGRVANNRLKRLQEVIEKLREKKAKELYGKVIECYVSDVGYTSILASGKYEDVHFEIEISEKYELYQRVYIRVGKPTLLLDVKGTMRLQGTLVE